MFFYVFFFLNISKWHMHLSSILSSLFSFRSIIQKSYTLSKDNKRTAQGKRNNTSGKSSPTQSRGRPRLGICSGPSRHKRADKFVGWPEDFLCSPLGSFFPFFLPQSLSGDAILAGVSGALESSSKQL
jgi:hypothetical protein